MMFRSDAINGALGVLLVFFVVVVLLALPGAALFGSYVVMSTGGGSFVAAIFSGFLAVIGILIFVALVATVWFSVKNSF